MGSNQSSEAPTGGDGEPQQQGHNQNQQQNQNRATNQLTDKRPVRVAVARPPLKERAGRPVVQVPNSGYKILYVDPKDNGAVVGPSGFIAFDDNGIRPQTTPDNSDKQQQQQKKTPDEAAAQQQKGDDSASNAGAAPTRQQTFFKPTGKVSTRFVFFEDCRATQAELDRVKKLQQTQEQKRQKKRGRESEERKVGGTEEEGAAAADAAKSSSPHEAARPVQAEQSFTGSNQQETSVWANSTDPDFLLADTAHYDQEAEELYDMAGVAQLKETSAASLEELLSETAGQRSLQRGNSTVLSEADRARADVALMQMFTEEALERESQNVHSHVLTALRKAIAVPGPSRHTRQPENFRATWQEEADAIAAAASASVLDPADFINADLPAWEDQSHGKLKDFMAESNMIPEHHPEERVDDHRPEQAAAAQATLEKTAADLKIQAESDDEGDDTAAAQEALSNTHRQSVTALMQQQDQALEEAFGTSASAGQPQETESEQAEASRSLAGIEPAPPRDDAAAGADEDKAASHKNAQEEELAREQTEEEAVRRKSEEEEIARKKAEEEELVQRTAQEEEAATKKKGEEDALRKQEEEEAMRRQEDAARQKAGEEEAAKKKAEEEEAARKKAEEEEAEKKRSEKEEVARKQAEEEAVREQAEEETRKKAEEAEAARKQAEEEEVARKQAEEEGAARKQAEEEEAARKKAEEEESAKKQAEEEVARKKAEEEEAEKKRSEEEELARQQAEEEEAVRKQAEEEEAVRKQAEEEEAVRKQAEEEEAVRKQAEEEEAVRKQAEEEAARKQAEEEEVARKEAEEAARKQAEEEEAARKQAEEEEAARKKAEEEEAAKKAEEEARMQAEREKLRAEMRRAEEKAIAQREAEEAAARKRDEEAAAAQRQAEEAAAIAEAARLAEEKAKRAPYASMTAEQIKARKNVLAKDLNVFKTQFMQRYGGKKPAEADYLADEEVAPKLREFNTLNEMTAAPAANCEKAAADLAARVAAMSANELQARKKVLSKDLNAFKTTYAAANGGQKPSEDDYNTDATASAQLAEFNLVNERIKALKEEEATPLSLEEVTARRKALSKELNTWKKDFAEKNGGRKPSEDDYKVDPYISAKLTEFNRLTELMSTAVPSGKPAADPTTTPPLMATKPAVMSQLSPPVGDHKSKSPHLTHLNSDSPYSGPSGNNSTAAYRKLEPQERRQIKAQIQRMRQWKKDYRNRTGLPPTKADIVQDMYIVDSYMHLRKVIGDDDCVLSDDEEAVQARAAALEQQNREELADAEAQRKLKQMELDLASDNKVFVGTDEELRTKKNQLASQLNDWKKNFAETQNRSPGSLDIAKSDTVFPIFYEYKRLSACTASKAAQPSPAPKRDKYDEPFQPVSRKEAKVLKSRRKELGKELNKWKEEFAAKEGRSPGVPDIEADPKISEVYREYCWIPKDIPTRDDAEEEDDGSSTQPNKFITPPGGAGGLAQLESDLPSDPAEIKAQKKVLAQELNQFKKEFAEAHGGEKPSEKDYSADPVMGQKLARFNRLNALGL